MITCSRCGKENQKHYKFCLGCGAKLEAPAAPVEAARAPSPAPSPAPSALGDGTAPIPTARVTGSASIAGSQPLASPGYGGFGGLAAASAPAPAVAPLPSSLPLGSGPVPTSHTPAPLDGSVGDRDMIPCPKCGKPVVATYAFCGSCGQRMKGGGSGVSAGGIVAAARTMHLGSSPAARTAPRGHLTLIRPDGTEGGVHPLQDGENLIGRGQGSLFDADPYLSPRHAEFAFTSDGLLVRDLRSLNGVFIKILQEEQLESADVFRIGQELLRFDAIAPAAPMEDGTETIGTPNPGFWGRISVIVGRDVDGPAFPLFDETVVLGRERGDILFPEDGYVSGTHAQLTLRDGHVFLSDLGSSNGTFYRIQGSRSVPSGSLLLMGQQLFRASYR